LQATSRQAIEIHCFSSRRSGKTDVIACATFDLADVGEVEFNGELPLEMDGNPTDGVLMLKATSGDAYPTEQDSH